MGTYLHPGKDAYEEAVNSKIFIDKTEMILFLNSIIKTRQKYLCVSRPRRFGKTTAADMICAYYDCDADSRSLFEKRKLAGSNPLLNGDKELPWDAYLEKFDVIRIVMTDFISDSDYARDMLDCLTEEIVDELRENYPDVKFANRIKLSTGMSKIYGKTKRRFVIVIDEWDTVFRTWENAASDQKEYLDFLRDWLKDKPYIALVYMTGILPIKKYGNHSALNMFTEYSMITPRQLAPYTGFTEDEVQSLCRQYGRDYDAIKNWYEGYEVSDIIPPDPDQKVFNTTGQTPRATRYTLYNPLSVVEAMITGRIRNYWNQTETYEALAEYIRKDYDGLKDAVALLMDGKRLIIDTSTYQNDMTTFQSRDDVLTLLIHLGYLGYDDETGEVSIPNKEILDEFKTSTKDSQ